MLIAALLLSTAPVVAQPVTPTPAPVVDDSRIAEGLRLAQGGDCKAALAILDPAAAALDGDRRTLIDIVRLNCLGSVGRLDEAARLQRTLVAADPTNVTLRGYGILIAADQRRFTDVADRIVAAADDRKVLAMVPGRLWTTTDAALREANDTARRDRAAVALARSDWKPADNPGVRRAVVYTAIAALARTGKADDADTLLDELDEPPSIVSLAIDRHYAALWPALETRLGPAQAKAIDAFAGTALETWAGAPADPAVRRDAVLAYLLLGRDEDAAALADQVQIGPQMAEEDVGAVQLGVSALQSLGRIDAAAARLKLLGAVDPAARPQAAMALIALPELYDEAGRPAEGLAAARAALARGTTALSPFGRAWIERSEVCTLATLGRTAEAKAVADQLRDNAGVNEAAAVEALLCMRRDAEAEALAVKTLATPDGAGRLADQFQPSGALGSPPSRLRDQWQRLLARPAMKAAFQKSARILPRTLWPARTARPVPRVSLSSGPTT